MKMLKLLSLFCATTIMLTACSATPKDDTTAKPTEGTTTETTTSKPEEQKPVILAVSFGTSYNDTRDVTIGAIENAIVKAYPEYEVRRAFTSQTIIDILADREKLIIDNVTQAMERLVADGVKNVIIQPTHVMAGQEFDDVVKEATAFKDKFDSFAIGSPLLTKDEDYDKLISVLTEETKSYNTKDSAVVFMGHGTHHESNKVYQTLQDKLFEKGHKNYIIGTVEATPTLDDVVKLLKDTGAKKVYLLPLMIVAGDHATNDMAGDEEGSWKTTLEKAGYEVESILKGMGEYKGIQDMIVANTKNHIKTESGVKVNDKVQETTKKDLTPVLADQIKDGKYDIEVESSSSMFKITACSLEVKEGKMTATMTLGGTGYSMLYMGTGEKAATEGDDKFINAVDAKTYTVPVEALNKEIDCAAFSSKKEKWYDRTLIFKADNIPAENISAK